MPDSCAEYPVIPPAECYRWINSDLTDRKKPIPPQKPSYVLQPACFGNDWYTALHPVPEGLPHPVLPADRFSPPDRRNAAHHAPDLLRAAISSEDRELPAPCPHHETAPFHQIYGHPDCPEQKLPDFHNVPGHDRSHSDPLHPDKI